MPVASSATPPSRSSIAFALHGNVNRLLKVSLKKAMALNGLLEIILADEPPPRKRQARASLKAK